VDGTTAFPAHICDHCSDGKGNKPPDLADIWRFMVSISYSSY
jgi:hypothetical protein